MIATATRALKRVDLTHNVEVHNICSGSKNVVNLLSQASKVSGKNRRGDQEMLISSFRAPCHAHLVADTSDRSNARKCRGSGQKDEESKYLEHSAVELLLSDFLNEQNLEYSCLSVHSLVRITAHLVDHLTLKISRRLEIGSDQIYWKMAPLQQLAVNFKRHWCTYGNGTISVLFTFHCSKITDLYHQSTICIIRTLTISAIVITFSSSCILLL